MAKIVRFHQIRAPEVLKIEKAPSREPGKGEATFRVQAIVLNRADSRFMGGSYFEPAGPFNQNYSLPANGPSRRFFKRIKGSSTSTMNSEIRLIRFINAHKILAPPIILGMMYWFHNWSTEAFVYLGLHGTYAMLWLVKSAIYPDKSFEERHLPFWLGTLSVFALLQTYYIAPYLLISRHVSLQPWVFGLVICCYTVGIFLHFAGDAQKYYTLRFRPGLIEDGLFGRTRNPNYLGETLIYLSFAIASWHWLSFLVLAGWFCFYFSNMLRKDRSLARYADFAAYKARTGILLPSIARGFRHPSLSTESSQGG